jgi:hypothetical protein
MAIKTDDEDSRTVFFYMQYGGNGDYYINLQETDKKILDSENDKLIHETVAVSMRIAMSGGNAPHEVRMAVANLFKAMEAHGLNKHPKDE